MRKSHRPVGGLQIQLGTTFARVTLVLILAAVSAVFAAPGSAATFKKCGTPQDGSVVGGGWVQSGPEYVSMAHTTAVRLWRRQGPGAEGFRGTPASEQCRVGTSVAVKAALAWVKSRRAHFALGVTTVGAGRNISLGRFRCTVLRSGRGKSGRCMHAADRHAGRIAVKFTMRRA